MRHLARRSRLLLALPLVAALVFVPTRSVHAGWDDFEFAQSLISKGYNEYARTVLQRILGDEKRPAADRERAKYGMALLGKAELISAAKNPKTPWDTLVGKMGEALAQIDDYISKNAADGKADEARFESASLRLWFVDLSSKVAQDPAALTERGTKAPAVLEEAQKQVESAIKTFQGLKTGAKKETDKELAEYQFVTASYFKGLVYPKCSNDAKTALDAAKRVLEDYALARDGQLIGVFAQDFLGKAFQEIGDCASDPKDQWIAYREALNWFSSAAATPDSGDDYRKVITLGYLHIGELANHVSGERPPVTDSKARDLLKEARRYLKQMEQAAPRANRMESGVLALVELGLIEWKLENGGEAIQVLKRASDSAQEAQLEGPRNRANSVLALIIAGGGGGGGGASAPSDPSVVFKVAEDLYSRGKWPEAISAYQQVLKSALIAPTPDLLKNYVYPSWSRIGSAYASQKLYLEAATAFDAIIDEVRAGRIGDAGETDKSVRTAKEALEKSSVLLKELADKTGEPAWRARLTAFTTERRDLEKDVLKLVGSAGELSYRLAREGFSSGLRLKEEDPKGTGWKTSFEDARKNFLETAKSVKSENQDVAWVYLVRIAYELGEWDGVTKAVDDALAYWKTPEAKRRYDEEERIRAARKGHEAALAFWKAAGFSGAGKKAESLVILDPYMAEHGRNADDYYRSRALGLRVEVLTDLQRMDDAEKALEDLLKADPAYYNLAKLLGRIAGYYQAQVTEISKKISALDKEWLGPPEARDQGLRNILSALDRRETSLVATISDLNQLVDRLKHEIDSGKLPETELKLKQEALKEAETKLRDAREVLRKVREDSATHGKRRDALQAEKLALQKQMAPPLRKSADLYRRHDEVIKALDAKAGTGKKYRKSDNVYSLGYRYLSLGRIDPETTENWVRARDLYEDYFGFDDVKALPEDHETKRRAHREIGAVYVQLAESAEAAGKTEDARSAYANAVLHLQPNVAKNPANSAVVVGHLAGELAILPFADVVTSRTWRFPVRRTTDVQAFKKYVEDLGGDRLPKYAQDKTQADYERALKSFQRTVAAMTPEQLQRTVNSLKEAGFDPVFFTEFGLADSEFLLTLARAYARAGLADYAWRALNTARAALDSGNKPEDDSPEWWEGRSLTLDVLVSIGERAAASAGAESGEAKSAAKQADQMLSTTKLLFPRIAARAAGPSR